MWILPHAEVPPVDGTLVVRLTRVEGAPLGASWNYFKMLSLHAFVSMLEELEVFRYTLRKNKVTQCQYPTFVSITSYSKVQLFRAFPAYTYLELMEVLLEI